MNHSKIQLLRIPTFALLALTVGLGVNAANEPIPLRVVAYTGQQAPGTSSSTTFVDFDAPVINNAGQTAFSGTVVQTGSPSAQFGMWFEGADHLNVAFLQGNQPTVNPSNPVYAFNDGGKFVYLDSNGIWMVTPAGRSPVARVGGIGDNFTAVGRPTINSSGTVAFSSGGCCSRGSIWTAQAGSISLVAQPGFYPPGTLNYFEGGGTPKIDAAGRVVVTDEFGIWSDHSGQFQEVLKELTPAPNLSDGAYFGNFTLVRTNARGDIAFPNPLYGGGSDRLDDRSIWRIRDGQFQLVARQGDPVPGFPSGVTFSTVIGASPRDWPLVMSDSGDVAFFVDLVGPGIDTSTRSTIWRWHEGSLQMVARNGMPAPGMPGTYVAAIGLPFMNGHGQIAFRASFLNVDQNFSGFAIFAEDANGNLHPIAMTGDKIDVDAGPGVDLRTINSFSLHSDDLLALDYAHGRGQSDQPFPFNDNGQIAFKVIFSDGTQAIVVSDLLAVPEPGAFALELVTICFIPSSSSLVWRRRQ
jgi:hypothetical protein